MKNINNEEAFSSQITQKKNFLSPQRESNTLSKSPIHLSFVHIYHFDMLSLAVWQDTCHTYKNLAYDLAHHESPIG